MQSKPVSIIVFCISIFLLGFNGLAEESPPVPQLVGTVAEFEGNVVYHQGDNVRGKQVKEQGQQIFELDGVRTKSNSWVLILLTDGSKVLLQEKSIVRFQEVKQVGVDAGKILFDIKKQGGVSGMRVTTRTAVIGVKGTSFLVSQDDYNTDVLLKEGLLDVDAKEGKFKKFGKPQTKEEFKSEFEQYKKDVKEEFTEYVKQIKMEAGMGISISKDNEVRDIKLSPEINNLFDRLNRYSGQGDDFSGVDAREAIEEKKEEISERKTSKPIDMERKKNRFQELTSRLKFF